MDGQLLSGSWDGTARVWDPASCTCTQVLEGHENGVSVLGLPNGDIVTVRGVWSLGGGQDFCRLNLTCYREWPDARTVGEACRCR